MICSAQPGDVAVYEDGTRRPIVVWAQKPSGAVVGMVMYTHETDPEPEFLAPAHSAEGGFLRYERL